MPHHFDAYGYSGMQPDMQRGMPEDPRMQMHPRMLAQQRIQYMQRHMGAYPAYMHRWQQYGNPRSERATWMSPRGDTMFQMTQYGPQMFAQHRVGGPQYYVHNPMDRRIAHRREYGVFAHGMGGMPRRFPGYRQWQAPRPYMGWQTGYGPGVYAPGIHAWRPSRYGRMRGNPSYRSSVSRRTSSRSTRSEAPSWGPEVEQMTGAEITAALQRITVLGRPIEVQGAHGSLAQRLGIPPSRIPEHIVALQQMAQRLEQGLQSRGWRNVRIVSNGLSLAAHDEQGQMMVATPTQLLIGGRGARAGSGVWESLTDGSRVQWSQLANGNEYIMQGAAGRARVVELPDGRMIREEQSDRGLPSATSFYDGDPSRPRIIRVNGPQSRVSFTAAGGREQTDLQHGTYVMGEGGLVAIRQPQSPQEAMQYLQQVAQRLRTPEAIGAFISSFMTVFDTVAKGGRRIASLAPVNFQAEPRGQQYIQSAMETIMKASGDCEDFAILASTLLEMAGITNVVARASHNHYKCAFLERAGNGYILCTIDTGGFARKPRIFRSPAEAMASLWSGRERSGVDWEVSNPAGMDPASVQQARQIASAGGGLSIIDTTTISGGHARISFVPFNSADLERLVHVRR